MDGTIKTGLHALLGSAILCALVGYPASPLTAATAARSITGEIVQIDGDFYVVKDKTGQEVRLHVDDNTARLDHAVLQVGDPILAYVTPEGHATSIKNLGPPDRIERDDIRKPGVTPSK